MAHEIECPHTDRKLTKREQVRYWRKRSAWFLAEKLGDVTSESYEAAYKLLDRCKNMSLGLYNLDEMEAEFMRVTPWMELKRNRLIKRMDKLNEELRPYGCHIVRAHSIEDVYDYDFERHVPLNDCGYLHFFD